VHGAGADLSGGSRDRSDRIAVAHDQPAADRLVEGGQGGSQVGAPRRSGRSPEARVHHEQQVRGPHLAGDSVLVPTPSYPLFEFLADLNDVKLVPYTLLYDHRWLIDFRSLQAGLGPQTRAIILVHPNNPTGSFVKWQEREALNQLCAERELALIADEVFLDYRHGAAMPDESQRLRPKVLRLIRPC
jgi:hypothetical protein